MPSPSQILHAVRNVWGICDTRRQIKTSFFASVETPLPLYSLNRLFQIADQRNSVRLILFFLLEESLAVCVHSVSREGDGTKLLYDSGVQQLMRHMIFGVVARVALAFSATFGQLTYLKTRTTAGKFNVVREFDLLRR